MRNWMNGWYIVITTEYHQTGRRSQHPNHRNWVNNLTSQWQSLNTNSRGYIQHLWRPTKHYPKWYGKPGVSHSKVAG